MSVRNLGFGLILSVVFAGCGGAPVDDSNAEGASGKADSDSTLPPNARIVTDSGATKLAKLLAGKSVVCSGSDAAATKSEDDGFFPITLSATYQGKGKTILDVETADPDIGFGDGGDIYDAVEFSASWIVVSQGDDGRRHLFLQNVLTMAPTDLADFACTSTDANLDGNISGVVTEIWDAGSISSRGVQCCLQ